MKYISLNKFVTEYKDQLPFESFPTIRDHVVADINGDNVLQVKVLRSKKGRGNTGLRYYIPIENIPLFIENLGKIKTIV